MNGLNCIGINGPEIRYVYNGRKVMSAILVISGQHWWWLRLLQAPSWIIELKFPYYNNSGSSSKYSRNWFLLMVLLLVNDNVAIVSGGRKQRYDIIRLTNTTPGQLITDVTSSDHCLCLTEHYRTDTISPISRRDIPPQGFRKKKELQTMIIKSAKRETNSVKTGRNLHNES